MAPLWMFEAAVKCISKKTSVQSLTQISDNLEGLQPFQVIKGSPKVESLYRQCWSRTESCLNVFFFLFFQI